VERELIFKVLYADTRSIRRLNMYRMKLELTFKVLVPYADTKSSRRLSTYRMKRELTFKVPYRMQIPGQAGD
jgi:hypothetical protein